MDDGDSNKGAQWTAAAVKSSGVNSSECRASDIWLGNGLADKEMKSRGQPMSLSMALAKEW